MAIRTYRIAISSAGLARGSFRVWGLPDPTVAPYATFTAKVPQGKGGLTKQGYKNVSLQWSDLSGLQLNTLSSIVDAAAGTLYLTIDRQDGSGVERDFINVHGTPQPVTYDLIPQARGKVFSNVGLVVTNLTVDADPAT